MNDNALVAMMYHVGMQCGIALLAHEDLCGALKAIEEENHHLAACTAGGSFEGIRHPDPRATLKVYAALQSLLNATANVYKALWGSAAYRTKRQDLRNALKVTDSSPLNVRQEVRNGFEHYDERLQEWAEANPSSGWSDSNIGPFEPQGKVFRHFNQNAMVVTFEEKGTTHTFDIAAVVAEIRRIMETNPVSPTQRYVPPSCTRAPHP